MKESFSSYSEKDVVFLLKNLNGMLEEQSTEERERMIQSGGHYSEMLPVEYVPSPIYMDLYHQSLKRNKQMVADSVAALAEVLLVHRGPSMVLVSLARAGSPAGILIKRYLKSRYGFDVPHFSISIVRGKGIDENALRYLLKRYSDADLIFVDGWTGKGAITKELTEAVEMFNKNNDTSISPELAVLADPGVCATFSGTQEDFLIPSSLLNSTVCGLVSRTVLREDLIGPNDFHGAKYYEHLIPEDLSYPFIESVEACFPQKPKMGICSKEPLWTGMEDACKIQRDFSVESIHFIKPGIGETTRVLLRRMPWKVILDESVSEDHADVRHVVQLAREKSVPVERMSLQAYRCCGIIKSVKGDQE